MSTEQKLPLQTQTSEVSQAPPQYGAGQETQHIYTGNPQSVPPMMQGYASQQHPGAVPGAAPLSPLTPGSQTSRSPGAGYATAYQQQQPQQTYFTPQQQQQTQYAGQQSPMQQQVPMQQQQQQQHPMPHMQQQSVNQVQTNTYQNVTPIGNLSAVAAPVQCPSCGQRAMTHTMNVSGNTTNAWALGLCVTTCLGCFAYLVDGTKDVVHNCGNCGVRLATWHRSGRTDQHMHV